MLLSLILMFVIFIGATAGVYYLIRYLKDPNYDYTDQSATLQTEEDMIQMKEAASIINNIKNRRESLPGSRRVSLDDVTGEFVNFRNIKLARAMSCDSVMSDNQEYDIYGNPLAPNMYQQEVGSTFRYEIPDITSWIKNPTDFFKMRSGSMEVGSEEAPWSPPSTTDTLISQLPSALISLSYLPTAERLSVVIVRIKIPVNPMTSVMKSLFIKAYLIDDKTGKKTCKKKTSVKPLESPIRGYQNVSYNELMIFKLPINQLTITSVRMTGFGIASANGMANETIPINETVINCDPSYNGQPNVQIASSRRRSRTDLPGDQIISFGHVVLGSNSPSPLAISHYNSMISTMRKPITMWHVFQPLGESTMSNTRDPPVPLYSTPAPPETIGANYDTYNNSGTEYDPQNYSGQWLEPQSDGQWSTQVVYQDTTTVNSNFHDVKL